MSMCGCFPLLSLCHLRHGMAPAYMIILDTRSTSEECAAYEDGTNTPVPQMPAPGRYLPEKRIKIRTGKMFTAGIRVEVAVIAFRSAKWYVDVDSYVIAPVAHAITCDILIRPNPARSGLVSFGPACPCPAYSGPVCPGAAYSNSLILVQPILIRPVPVQPVPGPPIPDTLWSG